MPFRGRMAYPSFVDETLFGNPHEVAVRRMKETPAAAKDVSLISSAELTGINHRSRKAGTEPKSLEQQRRDQLHELSNARKAKWPNTLEAARARKERARKEKLEAEEALRQEIDREEEALQAEKRRLAIERANKMLYDSTDRVKALHSKLLLTDVLQERELQLEVKAAKKERAKVEEAMWHQKTQEAIRKMDAEEDARDEAAAASRAEVARVRTEQLGEQRAVKEAQKRERVREGEMMKELAQSEIEHEKQARADHLERAAASRAEFVEANEFLVTKKREEERLMEAEEARMFAYAANKERDLLERRAREEERFTQRQQWRQKLIDAQIAKLTDVNALENERLEKQSHEVQQKANEARARLDAKKKDELLLTHMSLQQQIRWKQEKKMQQKADSAHHASKMKELNVVLREEEAQTIRDRLARAKERDEFLLKQMAQKQERLGEEKEKELYESEMSRQWMGDDDAIFSQYAQQCLDEYVGAGKNPVPIQIELARSLKGRSFSN